MTARAIRARYRLRVWAVIGVAALFALSLPMSERWHAAADPLTGSQGTDTNLPDTNSAATVHGRGPYSSLELKVNETRDLVNQAISLSWTGAPPTFSDSATHDFTTVFNGNYLQVFQCWGDPDPKDPLTKVNPGPPPTQCQFGAESNAPVNSYPILDVGFEFSRTLSQSSWANYAQTPGWVDSVSGFKVMPFKAVDGNVINQQADYTAGTDPFNPKAFWQNPYFSFNTSNEVPFARTYPDAGGATGHGQELFQVQTGLEAPGLGCGQRLQPVKGAAKKRPTCWLVVVPRGTPAEENPPGLTGVSGVVTSPLTPAAWANRIAIPLEFKPVDSTCALGADERRIVGSELATAAVTSWQPTLCAGANSPPYSYSYLSDDRARQNLTAQGFGGAGMSVFSLPPDPLTADPNNPVAYAPLTLSSIVVGVHIERTPRLEPDGTLQADERPLSGLRVADIRLTPRLMAKLLTQSYQAQLVSILATKPAKYNWVLNNPTNIVNDPDFVRFNPEFALLTSQQEIDASGLIVEQPSSDAALTLWQWVLADPEAKQWLDGAPDQWGMKVNPIYSTTAANNSTGAAFATTTPSLFSKSDPYCYNSGQLVGNPPLPARPICILDWSPYALTMRAAAQAAGAANSGAKTSLDLGGTPETAWKSNGPQKEGTRFLLSITDSASATRYGLQAARLSRAGDDGDGRAFIASEPASVLAAVAAMKPSKPSGVLTNDPRATAPTAYPLTLLTYAATAPKSLDASARRDYAAFLKFATRAGQTPGVGAGQLPPGYVPLPASLQTQAQAAVASILHPPADPPPPTTPTTHPTNNGGTTDGSGGVAPTDSGSDNGNFDSGSSFDETPAPSGGATPPTAPPLDTVRIVQPAAVTKAITVGSVRFALPIVLLIGLAAGGAALLRRPRRAARAPGDPLEPAEQTEQAEQREQAEQADLAPIATPPAAPLPPPEPVPVVAAAVAPPPSPPAPPPMPLPTSLPTPPPRRASRRASARASMPRMSVFEPW